jgi:AraC-like DNA-binding protein
MSARPPFVMAADGSRSLPPAPRSATQRVGNFAGLPMLVRQLGVDPVEILCNAKLAPDALEDPDRRVSYAGLGRFLRQAADRADCPQLGLLAGRMGQLSDFGLLGEMVRNSATAGAALRTLVRHQHLDSEGGLAFLIERGPMVDFGYAIYQQEFEAPDVMYDAAMATGINVLRELCGPVWAPSEVLLPHARPLDVTPYRKLFKQPRFDAEICALRFPAHWMTSVVEGADPAKLRAAREQAACVPPGDLLQQTRRAMREMLLHDKHSGEDLAKMMAMHRRTLNRRLKAEGTTFQQVLDSVRFTVARELLATSAISLDDVAATLGYAAVSPFMRAFARWSGTTPGHWRRAVASAPGSYFDASRRADPGLVVVPPIADSRIAVAAPSFFSSQGAR